MINKMKTLFEVTENDTLGTSFVKGMAEGYIKHMVVTTVTFGVLSVGILAIENYVENLKEDEEEPEEEKTVEELLEEHIEKYGDSVPTT